MRTLNLGILAHVDAGKTSLTERLLLAAGVIDELGSVDDGSTRTDSLDLERRRGITIKSAVVSFGVGDTTVNLIDTPGHPDFIAEVERVLNVLDGAVLVVSAVEGVQAQTRVLMRTLRRLGIPALVFVNKIDRRGARPAGVLAELGGKLGLPVAAMGEVAGAGTPGAAFVPYEGGGPGLLDVLALRDDALLAAYVAGGAAALPPARLRAALAAQSRRGLVHPVFFGSAITGAGVDELIAGLRELLPAAEGDPGGPVSGAVFKVERGPAGEKVAYARLYSGTLRVRDRLRLPGGGEARVTAIDLPNAGDTPKNPARRDGRQGREDRDGRDGRVVAAGQIARLRGLDAVRIGDPLGEPPPHAAEGHFAPPTLETVVLPARPADRGALLLALTRLAEQDPLIGLRQDDARGEISLTLYGEVQKEVIQDTLREEAGLEVAFRESTTICVERPAGTGAAAELIGKDPNPFLATVGLRVEPGPPGSGVTFGLEVELGSLPYAFTRTIEESVHETLRQGLRGWQVIDCVVTLTHSGYYARQSHSGGVFDKSMSSTAGDFRNLTPLVVMEALRRAGTVVCEPVHRFTLELPAGTAGEVLPVLARLGAVPRAQGTGLVEGEIPAAKVHELGQRLPGLTRGEGVLETAFERYRPVRGPAPARPRLGPDPLDRKEYLLRVQRRV
ncbi:TetM/TetW/TetO/TetS family tetracycline resistance ribosomal protection protein [Actinomadura sp. ATCC 31491]|uniref:TetM/TetW/TetO/TetS family tetracycline resistance ribosomal protection protein n=1 Tax=Actinomadura luzonensis TaxID=2805427 RepID=A0ABT0G627_9ACTN|nr:TetM/TetW/TetO/TetS family tetracycline resistance ribosomal protection protein [Actinomadura luzonensis]MCK2220058.1 TetM/TetW/TetO/TetS family tetracycline resistance ribosomal protection protein [Actinomadura luzonensis]